MSLEWWIYLLLALATFRLWLVLAEDSILDGPRSKLSEGVRSFVTCPWCLGAWLSLLTYLGWIAFGPGTWNWDDWYLGLVNVFALSAGVGLLGQAYHRLG